MKDTNNKEDNNGVRIGVVRLESSDFEKEYVIDEANGGRESAIKECNKDLHDKIVSDALLAGLSTLNSMLCTYLLVASPNSKGKAILLLGVNLVCIINRLLKIRKTRIVRGSLDKIFGEIEDKMNNKK
jgi:hypothetical protein